MVNKFYLIFFLIFLLNCVGEKDNFVQEFGLTESLDKNASIKINLDDYNKLEDLSDRASQISCNDSVSKINLFNSKKRKTVYFLNPCYEGIGSVLIKSKNVIEISNDTIFKNSKHYSLNNLEKILSQDYHNDGKKPELCDNPKNLLIKISNKPYNHLKLIELLDKITDAYYKISDTTDIKIWIKEKIKRPPPPPPPLNIEEKSK